MKNLKNQKGSMLIVVLIATYIFMLITMGSIGLGIMQKKLNSRKVSQAQALHVAEAGVNYYRWVLYHDNEEYCNKEACQPGPDYGPYGPYEYTDSSGNIKGKYELYITPPAKSGSTIVNVKSIGWISDYPGVTRSIEVKVGIPSWSTYSTLSNDFVRFGAGTEVWGPIHSNSGIRFDGVAHNLISSGALDFNDPDHGGANEFGVHTHSAPTDPLPDGNNPPLNVPNRTDVFMAGREFPIPIISFSLLDSHINALYTLATTSGLELVASGAEGYHISITPVPGENNDVLDIYTVNSVSADCYGNGAWQPTFGITGESFLMSTTTPANGVVFVKDRLWIDGQVNGDRATFLAFEDPLTGNQTDILINNDLVYTNYDGTDGIGLIAQRDISIGLFSEDDLRIDAALIAKEGRIGRNYYRVSNSGGCSSVDAIKNTITVDGSLATKKRYGFAWSDGTGYITRNLIYDNNLTFIPPPHFPSTGEYTFISWKEN